MGRTVTPSLERVRAVGQAPATLPTLVAVGVLIIWAVLLVGAGHFQFIVVAPEARAAFDLLLVSLRLFTAFVLFLFPEDAVQSRLRWLALGLLIQSLGTIGHRSLGPLAGGLTGDASLYASLLTRAAGLLVIAVGFVPARPPRLTVRLAAVAVGAFVVLDVLVVTLGVHLPPLMPRLAADLASTGANVMPSLTGWYWWLGGIPVAFGIAAAIGSVRHPETVLGWWVGVAMVLLAGANVYALFWPAGYGPLLTTASILALLSTITLGLGAFIRLRGVAAARAAQLNVEHQLTRMRADFAAMVAHELGSPIAVIREAADLIGTGPLDPVQSRARALIAAEVKVLATLVADVEMISVVERDSFSVHPRPVALTALLADAEAFARAQRGDHPFTLEDGTDRTGHVLADPERILQVLRNLLGNAARYSPPGSPIILRARPDTARIWLEVTNEGPGIHPDDLKHIFTKFGRGRHDGRHKPAGLGLGLYLSHRIVEAHGGSLQVSSIPGSLTTFAFPLEVVS